MFFLIITHFFTDLFFYIFLTRCVLIGVSRKYSFFFLIWCFFNVLSLLFFFQNITHYCLFSIIILPNVCVSDATKFTRCFLFLSLFVSSERLCFPSVFVSLFPHV